MVSSYRSVNSAGAGGTGPEVGMVPQRKGVDADAHVRWPRRYPGLVLKWARGRTARSGTNPGHHRRRGSRPRPAVGDDRLERPGQPDELRDLRAPGAVRVRRADGDHADAAGPPRGQGDRELRPARADGARHEPAARLRPVGQLPARLMRPFRAARGGEVVARLDPAEAGIVGLLLDQLEQLLDADADDVRGDPVMARLLPEGHRGEPELAADYPELTQASLPRGKADHPPVGRAPPARG